PTKDVQERSAADVVVWLVPSGRHWITLVCCESTSSRRRYHDGTLPVSNASKCATSSLFSRGTACQSFRHSRHPWSRLHFLAFPRVFTCAFLSETQEVSLMIAGACSVKVSNGPFIPSHELGCDLGRRRVTRNRSKSVLRIEVLV
ncbi:unnamed protein product, partial [Ixodes pacificus]